MATGIGTYSWSLLARGSRVPVSVTLHPSMSDRLEQVDLALLESIQHRVLWLAVRMVHEANRVRPNEDGSKVGGHQASSASVVSILTALYLQFMRAGDRIAIKPHAAPVFHALHYLLGRLPRGYLTQLRSYQGLQAYPSRTKDPVPVDFSTGSVGLGAVAPAFAALTGHYLQDHFGTSGSGRFIALVGDAELDEGSIWEALLEPALRGLGNLIWIVDLNRQSLDRVVPGIRAAQLKELFAASGWKVLEAKYGRRLQHIFTRQGGNALRRRIDEMSNEEYQSLLRLDSANLRLGLTRRDGVVQEPLVRLLHDIPDSELPRLLADLGGHDLAELLCALSKVEAAPYQPTVIFAYTIKGWGLPMAGDSLNHAALLTQAEIEELRTELKVPASDEWPAFASDSPEGLYCSRAARRLWPPQQRPRVAICAEQIPLTLLGSSPSTSSSQHAFGRALVRLAELPDVGPRVVTASPDVSTSTNLAGWINKTGVYARHELPRYGDEGGRLVRWRPGPTGRHIELGISEMNFFMLLGQLGLAHEMSGEILFPIGTVYDPFICRGLDALIYGLYSDARFIFAGTPSGVTLAPEGGAHQSIITPSLGLELPNLICYEPCFAREVEWVLLEALRQCCDREQGRSTYLRLSTRPIEQMLQAEALERLGEAEVRRQVLAGGYRLRDWRESNAHLRDELLVHIVTSGALVPETLAAAELLAEEGVLANVLLLTSPQLLFEQWRGGFKEGCQLARLIPPGERHAPIITVHDAHPHTLAWLGSAYGAPTVALGVSEFGQSGTRSDLYRHFELDAESIADAAFTALGY